MRIEKLNDGSHRKHGHFDKAGRWYPNKELYNIDGAFCVRSPSRSWPFSYLKHYYTVKFAKVLAISNPDLYCDIQGIEDRGPVIAYATAQRLAD